jgi:hypothetical protein
MSADAASVRADRVRAFQDGAGRLMIGIRSAPATPILLLDISLCDQWIQVLPVSTLAQQLQSAFIGRREYANARKNPRNRGGCACNKAGGKAFGHRATVSAS